MREVTRALLASAGFAVDVASDGAEALRLASEQRYAIILMDINMPTLGGVEAAHRIRALDGPAHAVPIVAMTAERGPERVENILEAGMNGYLSKPFGRSQLLDAIRPWIGVDAGLAPPLAG